GGPPVEDAGVEVEQHHDRRAGHGGPPCSPALVVTVRQHRPRPVHLAAEIPPSVRHAATVPPAFNADRGPSEPLKPALRSPSMPGGSPPSRPRVLADPELDARFARDGYAVVPMLDADEVEHLRAGHAELGPALLSDGGMAFDYMQDGRRAMERVTELLAPVWDRRLPEVFADHKVIFSTFVLKRPTMESGMYLHDDRSFVDERHHRSYALWVALDDTSPEIGNGCLYLVPGSQRIATAASGSNTPDWFTPYRG
ncbi:hypothetical protein B7486_67490, partial [cyanobacterium TDX16]